MLESKDKVTGSAANRRRRRLHLSLPLSLLPYLSPLSLSFLYKLSLFKVEIYSDILEVIISTLPFNSASSSECKPSNLRRNCVHPVLYYYVTYTVIYYYVKI